MSLQLPPPCTRSICLQYLLRHRHLQNGFELTLSQRPSECLPRLPEASLSTEYAAGSEQLRSINAERPVTHNTAFVAVPWFLRRRHQGIRYKKMRPFDHLFSSSGSKLSNCSGRFRSLAKDIQRSGCAILRAQRAHDESAVCSSPKINISKTTLRADGSQIVKTPGVFFHAREPLLRSYTPTLSLRGYLKPGDPPRGGVSLSILFGVAALRKVGQRRVCRKFR
jgi:hypothetical protein